MGWHNISNVEIAFENKKKKVSGVKSKNSDFVEKKKTPKSETYSGKGDFRIGSAVFLF
jgi:hypothetical protein